MKQSAALQLSNYSFESTDSHTLQAKQIKLRAEHVWHNMNHERKHCIHLGHFETANMFVHMRLGCVCMWIIPHIGKFVCVCGEKVHTHTVLFFGQMGVGFGASMSSQAVLVPASL